MSLQGKAGKSKLVLLMQYLLCEQQDTRVGSM